MDEHAQGRLVVQTLERLLSGAREAGLSLGHAQRFFDVGEWALAYEELLYAPERDRLSAFKVDHAAAFGQVDEWLGMHL